MVNLMQTTRHRQRWDLFLRLFHTLWPMLPVQWVFLIYYRVLRKRIPVGRVPARFSTRDCRLQPCPDLPKSRLHCGCFLFLNECSPWTLENIDWVSSKQKKLWRYNLHYFDWLREPEPEPGLWQRIIHDWIDSVPYGDGDGWEPYPLSLRIVNWIKWLTLHPDLASNKIRRSLYQQCYALEKQIEYHIQANHLYKNAVAMVFAGCYFNDAQARRWFVKGKRLWLRETHRQFLQDGGHVERSPLYHALCLEDHLDVINLLRSNAFSISDTRMDVIASRAVRWLLEMSDSNGEIVLLNDSACGIAPTPKELLAYALRVGLKLDAQVSEGVTCLAQSGYLIYRDKSLHLVFDASDIGPSYQPGHTHCDMLSFLLWYQGQPLFIDSGVGSYLDDDERRYARSTCAHNTLMIDEQEQSDIWSAFRVGARARVLQCTGVETHAGVVLRGSHNGYSRIWRGVIHARTLSLRRNKLHILDSLVGATQQTHRINIYFHLSQHHRVVIEDNYCVVNQSDGVTLARIQVPTEMSAKVTFRPFFPEFGLSIMHPVVELTGIVTFPFRAETIIHFN